MQKMKIVQNFVPCYVKNAMKKLLQQQKSMTAFSWIAVREKFIRCLILTGLLILVITDFIFNTRANTICLLWHSMSLMMIRNYKVMYQIQANRKGPDTMFGALINSIIDGWRIP